MPRCTCQRCLPGQLPLFAADVMRCTATAHLNMQSMPRQRDADFYAFNATDVTLPLTFEQLDELTSGPQ